MRLVAIFNRNVDRAREAYLARQEYSDPFILSKDDLEDNIRNGKI